MPDAFLLDLDGTLYTDAGAIRGGPETLSWLRGHNVPFRCVTNTTSRARAGLVERLAAYGYLIAPEEILTPVSAAVAHCHSRGLRRALALVPDAALPDLETLELLAPGEGTPDAVILGDLGERWSFALLQHAFDAVLQGAELVALSRDRYFQKSGRLTLDAGPFAVALEYATGRTATLVGKPSLPFYQAGLASLGREPRDVVMVGDDLWSDIQGAQRAGITAWLVRTGKFREEALRESAISPDRIIGSVAELLDT
jgi:HAD superfamily hydrolase (TIGR01458 family)